MLSAPGGAERPELGQGGGRRAGGNEGRAGRGQGGLRGGRSPAGIRERARVAAALRDGRRCSSPVNWPGRPGLAPQRSAVVMQLVTDRQTVFGIYWCPVTPKLS